MSWTTYLIECTVFLVYLAEAKGVSLRQSTMRPASVSPKRIMVPGAQAVGNQRVTPATAELQLGSRMLQLDPRLPLGRVHRGPHALPKELPVRLRRDPTKPLEHPRLPRRRRPRVRLPAAVEVPHLPGLRVEAGRQVRRLGQRAAAVGQRRPRQQVADGLELGGPQLGGSREQGAEVPRLGPGPGGPSRNPTHMLRCRRRFHCGPAAPARAAPPLSLAAARTSFSWSSST